MGLDPTAAQVEVARERGGGPVYMRARAEALPCGDGSFDTVLVCLALEHVDAFEEAIAEVARVLEPGGRFVLLLAHPLLQAPGSAWIDDRILGEMYWRVGSYLTEDRQFDEVAPGVELLFIHRPLSRYVHAMGQAGLLIDDMVEEVAAGAGHRGELGLSRGGHHPARLAPQCDSTELTGTPYTFVVVEPALAAGSMETSCELRRRRRVECRARARRVRHAAGTVDGVGGGQLVDDARAARDDDVAFGG